MPRREQTDKLKLRAVCILILIDADILKAMIVIVAYLIAAAQQLDGLHYYIVKVDGVCLGKVPLIKIVYARNSLISLSLAELIVF